MYTVSFITSVYLIYFILGIKAGVINDTAEAEIKKMREEDQVQKYISEANNRSLSAISKSRDTILPPVFSEANNRSLSAASRSRDAFLPPVTMRDVSNDFNDKYAYQTHNSDTDENLLKPVKTKTPVPILVDLNKVPVVKAVIEGLYGVNLSLPGINITSLPQMKAKIDLHNISDLITSIYAIRGSLEYLDKHQRESASKLTESMTNQMKVLEKLWNSTGYQAFTTRLLYGDTKPNKTKSSERLTSGFTSGFSSIFSGLLGDIESILYGILNSVMSTGERILAFVIKVAVAVVKPVVTELVKVIHALLPIVEDLIALIVYILRCLVQIVIGVFEYLDKKIYATELALLFLSLLYITKNLYLAGIFILLSVVMLDIRRD